jgi:hypothetical protein
MFRTLECVDHRNAERHSLAKAKERTRTMTTLCCHFSAHHPFSTLEKGIKENFPKKMMNPRPATPEVRGVV